MHALLNPIFRGVAHYLVGSIFYDAVHGLAHSNYRKSCWLLGQLSRMHTAHHQWYNRKLQINHKYRRQNLLSHLPMELLCQVVGTGLSWAILSVIMRRSNFVELVLVWAVQVTRSSIVAWHAGFDSNHFPHSRLLKDNWSLFVGSEYHALHHIDPSNYFGSMVRVIDWLIGSATSLRGRRVAITGAHGALGQALQHELRKSQVKSIRTLQFGHDWTLTDFSALEPILRDTDILILAHGTKDKDQAMEANCNAAAKIIELFQLSRWHNQSSPSVDLLPEVWYVGSEAEVHGSWTSSMDAYVDSKRAFAKFAKGYYNSNDFIYRHIVPAAFTSPMGPGMISARWVARLALWWIRRGARYVPVTYTGFAFVNYFRFRYFTRAQRSTDERVSNHS